MSYPQSKRSPQQQLALEKKLGLGLLAGLSLVFFALLSARVGNFGWNEEKVEVNLGGGSASSSVADVREPFAPPEVYLPPSPPAVAVRYPLAAPSPTSPAVAVAQPVKITAAPRPAEIVPPALLPAAPTTREPGVAAIGLVAGSEPLAPIRSSPPVVAPQIAPSTAAAVYVFADGDNFWTIAQRAYGDGAYYRALFAFNQDRYPHPEDLRPGDRIDLPPREELQRRYPQWCPQTGTTGATALPAGGLGS